MTQAVADQEANGDFLERRSRWSFDETLERVRQAIAVAGMQVFATVDHARSAQEVGLSMPPATLLIYGKAEGGTPIMLHSPRSALDLPLHVLVRADGNGSAFVSYHAIVPRLLAAGVPASLAERLQPAQALILKAIAE